MSTTYRIISPVEWDLLLSREVDFIENAAFFIVLNRGDKSTSANLTKLQVRDYLDSLLETFKTNLVAYGRIQDWDALSTDEQANLVGEFNDNYEIQAVIVQ
jgi:hypothetical protein